MVKLDMQILTKDLKVIGQDRLVELKLLQPGIIIGVWKVIFKIIIHSFIVAGKWDGKRFFFKISK